MKFLVFLAILLASLAQCAHAQVVTCPESVQGQPFSACAQTVNTTDPSGKLVLFCSGTGVDVKTAFETCSATQWLSNSSMQTWSWVWTVQGWQRHGEMDFGTPQPPTPEPPQPSVGSLTLNWTAPTVNTDGTPLTNIAGYRIEYGETEALGRTINVGNVLSHTLTGLTAGTWYAALYTLTQTSESVRTNLVSGTVVAEPPPGPVDCVVSAWSDWVTGPWGACVNGLQSRTETRARTITVQPANGGAACPALLERVTVSQPCMQTKTWKVAPIASGSRPVYEAVLSADGAVLVRGTVQGSILVGQPCSTTETYRVGSNSYRDVNESDLTLTSPTYRGRRHTALCTLQ